MSLAVTGSPTLAFLVSTFLSRRALPAAICTWRVSIFGGGLGGSVCACRPIGVTSRKDRASRSANAHVIAEYLMAGVYFSVSNMALQHITEMFPLQINRCDDCGFHGINPCDLGMKQQTAIAPAKTPIISR